MRPGQVTSDEQAFQQILGRLRDDVGQIIDLVSKAKERGQFAGAPFWALVRMTFPVAESIGDLIYGGRSTENLEYVLKNECEAVRTGYRRIAATLAQLFRHSLIHTDEMRALVTGGIEVNWLLAFNEPHRHLVIDKGTPELIEIQFDLTAFYEDLRRVCESAMRKKWSGQVMNRYNGWLALDIDREPNPQRDRTKAEIAAL